MSLPAERTYPRPAPELMERAHAALVEVLSAGQVRRDASTLENYARDESDSGVYPPDVVVFPETTAQVSAVFRACQTLGVPFTPCGARSGKSGGSLPLRGGVAVSLERMNRILSISGEDLTAVVQPGVITGELMKAVEAQGLFYPPDPNSWEFCTMGGNVAENAGGPRALKYGVTRDYVIGLEWVLPYGEVLRVGRRTIKGVAGYDLVGLFVGSEGTLGVATEITLQLIPLPRYVKTALVVFESVHAAARGITAVLAAGLLPRTLELIDETALQAVDEAGLPLSRRRGLGRHRRGGWATCDEGLFAELAELGAICERHGAREVLVAQDESQRDKLWEARRKVSPRPCARSSRTRFPRTSRFPARASRTSSWRSNRWARSWACSVATYGHAGDGNLHANILYDGPHQRALVETALQRMLALTVSFGGTITGEHGVGHAKREYLALEQPEPLLELQRRLKAFL